MINFLVKRFVKNSDQTEDAAVRAAYGTLAGVVGIICNLLLSASKLAVGLMVNSISVMADAFNNLSDAVSSLVGFVGVRMAQKPADQEHPFGHGRIEYIAAFIVAFLVLQVGLSLFKTSLGKILHPEELSFSWSSLAVLGISVCMKLWLALFNRRLGDRIHSKVMLATSADALGDVLATSATALSLVLYGVKGWNVDGIVGLAVSVVVFLAGINIAKDTLAPLIGEAIDPEEYAQISNFVRSFDGIVGTHDLLVHNYGPNRNIASIHAEVPADTNMNQAHEVVDRIEREAMRRFGLMLVIHMDPVETHNEEVLRLRKILTGVLWQIDVRLNFHDFRVVQTSRGPRLVFDLVIPREYKGSSLGKLRTRISDEMARQEKGCSCNITTEYSYLAQET